jgi:hypothetical protein
MCYDSKVQPTTRLQRGNDLIGFVSIDKYDEQKMPKNPEDVEMLARAHTDAAIKTLAEIMMDPSAPTRARNVAAATLHDYGFLGGGAAGDQRVVRAFHVKSKG